MAQTDEQRLLIEDASALGLSLDASCAQSLLRLLDELAKWNRTHNLTAITARAEMITHHLLDSLSAHGELRGGTVADVGTGAGFPGLPLAIVENANGGVQPAGAALSAYGGDGTANDVGARKFTLIDSNNKKVMFVAHAARMLGLANVTAVHARAEGGMRAIDGKPFAEKPFDTVITRAFAALPELLSKVAPLCGPQTRVVAMKGRRPDDEITAVPPDWRVIETRPLVVPGLHEDRHVVILQRAGDSR